LRGCKLLQMFRGHGFAGKLLRRRFSKTCDPRRLQVPLVSLAAPQEEAARLLHHACIDHGFFYCGSNIIGALSLKGVIWDFTPWTQQL
jgi:hypothetical protein